MTQYTSQIGQDKFVIDSLHGKRNGTFLDVGCHHFQNLSNTFFLEKELGWRGIGIDMNDNYRSGWLTNRSSIFICQNALTVDYGALLKEHNMPDIIDYLTVDLEPPSVTLQGLYKVFESGYSFNVITFETDAHRIDLPSIKEESRSFLKDKGFILIREENVQDDFYVHERIVKWTEYSNSCEKGETSWFQSGEKDDTCRKTGGFKINNVISNS